MIPDTGGLCLLDPDTFPSGLTDFALLLGTKGAAFTAARDSLELLVSETFESETSIAV